MKSYLLTLFLVALFTNGAFSQNPDSRIAVSVFHFSVDAYGAGSVFPRGIHGFEIGNHEFLRWLAPNLFDRSALETEQEGTESLSSGATPNRNPIQNAFRGLAPVEVDADTIEFDELQDFIRRTLRDRWTPIRPGALFRLYRALTLSQRVRSEIQMVRDPGELLVLMVRAAARRSQHPEDELGSPLESGELIR